MILCCMMDLPPCDWWLWSAPGGVLTDGPAKASGRAQPASDRVLLSAAHPALWPTNARICRNEGVACTYIYEPDSILTHGLLGFISDRAQYFLPF